MAPKAAPKAAPTHAPYVDMIKSAIVSLKDRTGSSLPALQKKIGKFRIQSGLRGVTLLLLPCVTLCWLLLMLTSNSTALSQLA